MLRAASHHETKTCGGAHRRKHEPGRMRSFGGKSAGTGRRQMRTTIIKTAEPSAFVHLTAASGIGLSPFVLDPPAVLRATGHLRLVHSVSNDRSAAPQRRAS
jgi:hypothetical protein